jgi:hypothetical protein
MRILLMALAPIVLGFGICRGQEGASLAEVEALMAQGRIMEARGTLETWWTSRFSMASRADRQRGIWLRGKLTVDPSMAELDFKRLALEFPGGPYSDDALCRLALSAELRGDLREAQGFFENLVRDYPSSPRIREARRWISEHAAEIAALPEELSPDSFPAKPVEEVHGDAQAPGVPAGGSFSVQLGAFRSLERALSLADRLKELGYRARVVRTPGNDLARVRIGAFESRGGAEALARELEQRGFDVTLVTDAGSEERVGKPPRGESWRVPAEKETTGPSRFTRSV